VATERAARRLPDPRAPVLSGHGRDGRLVGWLELFYDLVFAGAVVTFSDAVSHNPVPEVLGVVAAAFVAVWLIWAATTMYVNAFGIDDALHRVLVVLQMLLLTLVSLAVGDGLDRNAELACGAYALLVLDVAVMYGRSSRGDHPAAPLARMRRNQLAVASVPILVATFVGGNVRTALQVLTMVLVAIPVLSYRIGRARGAPFDEAHLTERLGLLTIIVIGEAFVKVSLVVTDGHLDTIDAVVLVSLFVAVFAIWWSYFDDVPDAGIRDAPAASIGWLVGHVAFQLFLVGVAVAYGKWLQLEEAHAFTGERSLLGSVPYIGAVLALALIGVCTRRVPQRRLLALRLATALVVGAVAVANWRRVDSSLKPVAIGLALIALVHSAIAAWLTRGTTVMSAPVDAT
jgi:low temperature requirement protein LtrA